ncbi:uncharacterized protein KY384_001490 [Bacidia gigantensis]|uniref:uncharacterized protein n=1 Tax=Bacidia gigantensis TaxID=2732470 RepID=UPI001D03CE7A|nr:uncharacterized protein KY384_001490 [Bacidia gigantensis]KAG8533749.1 hypothetical protein KY384_001490 [Bacidia gigantensis]
MVEDKRRHFSEARDGRDRRTSSGPFFGYRGLHHYLNARALKVYLKDAVAISNSLDGSLTKTSRTAQFAEQALHSGIVNTIAGNVDG